MAGKAAAAPAYAYPAPPPSAHAPHQAYGEEDEAPTLFSEASSAPRGAGRRGDDDFIPRFPPNPLSEYLAKYLKSLVDLGTAIRDNILYNSPVIILSGGAALAANYLAAEYYPSLAGSADVSFEGSVNVAKFVSVALLLEAALTPLFQNAETSADQHSESRSGGKIHSKAIHYLNPLALTLLFAYKTGLNVKALHGTLYTVGIFALIKALGMNYDYALRVYQHASYERF